MLLTDVCVSPLRFRVGSFHLLASAKPISAADAAACGLVQDVATTDAALQRTVDDFLAGTLKAYSLLGLTMTKHALHAGVSSSCTFAEALQLEDRQQALCLNSSDCIAHGAQHVSGVVKRVRAKL